MSERFTLRFDKTRDPPDVEPLADDITTWVLTQRNRVQDKAKMTARDEMIDREARDAYASVNKVEAGEICTPWEELGDEYKTRWRALTKHLITQGVAIGAMDSDLTQAFLNAGDESQ